MTPTLLTDKGYERLMREGSKEYSNQQFLRAWYFCFDKINKSNKKSIDSLLNSVFCLMKAGEVRQYYFSEAKFTDMVHEKISDILAFEPSNIEAQELRAKLYRKQGLLEKAYLTLVKIWGKNKDMGIELETRFGIGEVLLDLGRVQDAVEHFEYLKKNGYDSAKLYPKLADAYYKLGDKEKIAGLVNIDKIFDTNDPSFGLIFAQVEYEMGYLESSLYVCKWLLHYHGTESTLWLLLEKIFQKLENKNYAKFAQQTSIYMESWVEQLATKFTELQEAGFYDAVAIQAFSNDKMRQHLEKKHNLTGMKRELMAQDEVLELPFEERSFESILAELEEEDIYVTELNKEIEEDEQIAQFEENELEERMTRGVVPSEDDEEYEAHFLDEDSQKFDEYIAHELEEYGLTDEEISAYQSLPD